MHEIKCSSKAREIENDFFFDWPGPQYCPFDGIQIYSQWPIFHVEVPGGIGKILVSTSFGHTNSWGWEGWGPRLVLMGPRSCPDFFFSIVQESSSCGHWPLWGGHECFLVLFVHSLCCHHLFPCWWCLVRNLDVVTLVARLHYNKG